MKRTKIKFKDAIGQISIGYAILPDDTKEHTYFWCFDSLTDNYGYTLCTTDIIKIYK